MNTIYKRKRISNLDDLDKEEARLRKKAKKIEKEWVEMLNPQQLAIDFALGFLTNKITGKASPLKFVTSLFSSKSKVEKGGSNSNSEIKVKKKKGKAMKIVKGIGIALVAIQAAKLLIGSYKKNKNKRVLAH